MLDWLQFYEAFADNLLNWQDKRQSLFEKIREFAKGQPLLHYLRLEESSHWPDRVIDPFTVLGIFNRGTTAEHRSQLAAGLANTLGLKGKQPPTVFHGIPYLDPRHSIYSGHDQIWDLFLAAMPDPGKNFAASWDKAIAQKGNALGTLSMALYWARPLIYMPVDKISAPFLKEHFAIAAPEEKCPGSEYLDFLRRLGGKPGNQTYPQICLEAWRLSHE